MGIRTFARRFPRPLGNVLLLVVSLLFSLVFTEVIIRVVIGAPQPERMPLVRVKADPDLGWAMLPGDFHYTYQAPVQLNSIGFRGPEPGPRHGNEYRILVLGDSHIYGQGIEDASLLSNHLERALNNKSERCLYRVFNMGVRAYSINQELALLRKVGLNLHPDHVLLFFYINDFVFTDITKRYEQYEHLDWYMYDISGQPTESEIQSWKRVQLFRRSALLMWGYDLVRGFQYRDGLEQQILNGTITDDIKIRFDEVRAQLMDFMRLTEKHRINMTLIVIPVSSQILHKFPNEQYQSSLARYAEDLGLQYVDPRPAMINLYDRTGNLPIIPYDGHYDADGQRTMGLAVARKLKASIRTCSSGVD